MALSGWTMRAVKGVSAEDFDVWSPASGDDRSRWFAVTPAGVLQGLELVTGERFFEARLPFSSERVEGTTGSTVMVKASPSGRSVAVAQRYGLEGAVFDVESGKVVCSLLRDGDNEEHCSFPFVFLDDRRLLHSIAWNALCVTDLQTGQRLTPEREVKLDYFYADLWLSPGGTRVASAGWVWHPVGLVGAFELAPWLGGAVDEPTVHLAVESEPWDLPVCWLDDDEYATFAWWGKAGPWKLFRCRAGEAAVEVREESAGRELVLRRDEVLSLGKVSTAMGRAQLEKRWEGALDLLAWHPGAQEALLLDGGALHLAARPRPATDDLDVRRLAQATLGDASAEARSVLADALEQRGIGGAEVDHLRSLRPHDHRRCHVIEDLAAAPG